MEGISVHRRSIEVIAAMTQLTMETTVSNPLALSNNPPVATDAKKPRESMHWRSAGWTPLAYPISALVTNARITTVAHVDDAAQLNPFFPLHKDVLRAATRELLILDGSIESKTLKLSSKTARFRKPTTDVNVSESIESEHIVIGPRYLNHANSDLYVQCFEELNLDQPKRTRKRKASRATQRPNKKKRKVNKVSKCFSVQFEEDPSATLASVPFQVKGLESAEALSTVLIRLALHVEPEQRAQAREHVRDDQEKLDYQLLRPPRKISDADSVESVDLVDEAAANYNEISRLVDLTERNARGAYQFRRADVPLMMDVSIASEQNLRNAAFGMVSKMTKSFSRETLRLFLGYRASSVKREKVLVVLSDFLYDVSHALFAWNQTEQELVASHTTRGQAHTFNEETDTIVKNLLFDNRALKKIGGFDDYSLLRHALSVARSASQKETWEDFALSDQGQKLLAHHADGKAFLAGRKRRAHRVKHRLLPRSTEVSEDGDQRSRASSIGSLFDEVENGSDYRSRTFSGEFSVLFDSKWTNLPNVLHLTLKREVGETWGVLLAREGDMCVVDRAPEKESAESYIRRGDMILSVKNVRGERASPPSSFKPNERTPRPDWFREIVLLFKTSNELYLVVRRV